MWVRSQDKRRLIKCNNLSIKNGVGLLVGKFTIEESGITLGIYSNEKKALKVLDMIEGAIQQTEFPHHIYPIFQMPQDSEV